MFQQNSFNRINAAGMEKTLVLQGLSPSQLIYSCHSDRCAQSNAPDRPKSLAPFRTTKKMWFHGFLVVVMLLAPVACCRKSVLEKDYGHSWAYNEAVQIANPGASLDQTPATGLSPGASVNVMGAYNASFSGAKSGGGASTTINLGGLTTAGGSGGK